MKEEQEDRELSELFRQKLENAEVRPSPHVGNLLMRKLARREFLRFNPGRFNAWYAGGIAVTAIVLALVLYPDQGISDESFTPSVMTGPVQSEIKARSRSDNDAVSETVIPETEKKEGKKKAEQPSVSPAVHGSGTRGDGKSAGTISSAEVPQISDGSIITSEITDMNKLKRAGKRYESPLTASVTEGCVPLKVMFSAGTGENEAFRWYFGDGGSSEARNPEWIYRAEGEYEVILKVYSENESESIHTIYIKVHPAPVARFEITPENPVIPDNEITFHNYSVNAVRYDWNFGDGTQSDLIEPKHSYERYGNYNVRLIAFSEFGCSDSLMVSNAFGSGYFIRFPNAFIPNPGGPAGGSYSSSSDDNAYIFHPVQSGVAEYQLRIFSRRGILVFESNDLYTGWDGYYKGQLVDPGVYIWEVRGRYVNGAPFNIKGDVTLLKGQ